MTGEIFSYLIWHCSDYTIFVERDVTQGRDYRFIAQQTVLWNRAVRNSDLASTKFIDIRKFASYSSPQNSFLNKQNYKS